MKDDDLGMNTKNAQNLIESKEIWAVYGNSKNCSRVTRLMLTDNVHETCCLLAWFKFMFHICTTLIEVNWEWYLIVVLSVLFHHLFFSSSCFSYFLVSSVDLTVVSKWMHFISFSAGIQKKKFTWITEKEKPVMIHNSLYWYLVPDKLTTGSVHCPRYFDNFLFVI